MFIKEYLPQKSNIYGPQEDVVIDVVAKTENMTENQKKLQSGMFFFFLALLNSSIQKESSKTEKNF